MFVCLFVSSSKNSSAPDGFGKEIADLLVNPNKKELDLLSLITAQATIRLSLERRWLDDYVEYLNQEEEKRKAREGKWEDEKRERSMKRRRQTKKIKTKVRGC